MIEQAIEAVDDRGSAGGNVGVGLALQCLPALSPEPSLIGRYSHNGLQLEHAILSLDEPDLGSGFLEVQATAEIWGQGDGPPGLDTQDVALHALQHSSNAAVVKKQRTCQPAGVPISGFGDSVPDTSARRPEQASQRT